MVGIRVASLQGEHRCVWWCVQLHDGLHWQRAVDEVRRLIVHILDVYDDPLVVRVCKQKGTHFVTHRNTGALGGCHVARIGNNRTAQRVMEMKPEDSKQHAMGRRGTQINSECEETVINTTSCVYDSLLICDLHNGDVTHKKTGTHTESINRACLTN